MKDKLLTDEEITAIRAETKGANLRIHFNNAGASLPPDCVVDTVIHYLKEESVYGGYEMEANHKHELEHTYHLISRLINAEPEEIAITENASTAWCLAFQGIKLVEGNEVITSEMEYASNLLGFIKVQNNHGIKVKVIPNSADGNFCLSALEAVITHQTRLIAITHIASATGSVMPVAEIGEIASRHHILYLVDGCQSAGQIPLDVKQIKCDMLSVTGRKYLRAPRGTGFLYVKKQVQNQVEPVFLDQHSIEWMTETNFRLREDAKKYELFEKNRALILGLGKAIEYALGIGLDRIWYRIQALAACLRDELRKINGIVVYDQGNITCGIVTFSISGIESNKVRESLAENNIHVFVSGAASTLIYMNRKQLKSIIRASVHYYNNYDEINTLCKYLIAIIAEATKWDTE